MYIKGDSYYITNCESSLWKILLLLGAMNTWLHMNTIDIDAYCIFSRVELTSPLDRYSCLFLLLLFRAGTLVKYVWWTILAEAVIEKVYKDGTTARWATIRIDRNKLKETQRSQTWRKSGIKRKPEQACDNLQKAKTDATDESMDSLKWRELITKFQKKSMHIAHSCMKLGLGGS